MTRRQMRWGPRLRTAGALGLLAGAVGIVDQLLPQAADPVLGRSPLAIALPVALLAAGAAAFLTGRRWKR